LYLTDFVVDDSEQISKQRMPATQKKNRVGVKIFSYNTTSHRSLKIGVNLAKFSFGSQGYESHYVAVIFTLMLSFATAKATNLGPIPDQIIG
jgi:hypothetical protein